VQNEIVVTMNNYPNYSNYSDEWTLFREKFIILKAT